MAADHDAGLDLEAAEELLDRIEWRVTSTWTEDVLSSFGGFAAGIRVPPGYRKPVLMMATDGVGTKAEVARLAGDLSGLGYDLVAMCVDDLAAAGARPIAMTDYLVMGQLDVNRAEEIIESITDACNEAEVALLGGETTEHPGVVEPERFDLAGMALGVVELGEEVDGSEISVDDVLIGVHSPNLRSSGFELVRALIVDQVALDEPFPGSNRSAAEVLLEPSVVYSPAVLDALARAPAHGLSHITGGGLPWNLWRVLPEGHRAIVDTETWEVPEVFQVIAELGPIPAESMFRTFNMGIGFVAVAAEEDAEAFIRGFGSYDLESAVIGTVVEGDRGVEIK